MDAYEHVLLAAHVAGHERDVGGIVHERVIAVRGELAVPCGKANGRRLLDEPLVAAAVTDEVGDRDHLEAESRRNFLELRPPGHRTVLVQDLADDTCRGESRKSREVDRGLRVAGTLEHAAGLRAQREYVPGHRDVVRT